MKKFKNKQVFVIYVIMFALLALIFKSTIIKAEEAEVVKAEMSNQVFEVEINNNPNFEDVKTQVLIDDVKYLAHPEKLALDVSLGEIITSDIDYSSYEVQQVEFEVERFADSKIGKTKIDSVVGVVQLKFIDKTPPEITIKKESVTITEGEKLDVDDYLISVTDNSFEKVVLDIEENINTDKSGKYTAVYTATDSSGNTDSKTLTVIVKEKPKPKLEPVPLSTQKASLTTTASNSTSLTSGAKYQPSIVTRYGYDCRGCSLTSGNFSGTASGIKIGADRVRQANGEWKLGYTYEGYYIVSTSSSIPLFSILKISNHPFSGGGIVAGQPFYAIVADRGVGGNTLDLFSGTETNLNIIRQSGNPRSSNTVVEIVRVGR